MLKIKIGSAKRFQTDSLLSEELRLPQEQGTHFYSFSKKLYLQKYWTVHGSTSEEIQAENSMVPRESASLHNKLCK